MATRSPRHPAYLNIIHRLLLAAPRKGMSLQAIRKDIQQKYSLPDTCRRGIRLAIRRALRSGVIRHGTSTQTYKLSKSAAKTRSVKKMAAAKKARLMKKVKITTSPAVSPAGSPAISPPSSPSTKLAKKIVKPKIVAKMPKLPKKSLASFAKPYIWQYVDNHGKYANYDPAASDVVEECYEEYQKNPHMMDVRAVRSGDWQYQVDFIQMKQTNIQHENHRVRTIRRIPNPNS